MRTARTWLPEIRKYAHKRAFPDLGFNIDMAGMNYAEMRGREQLLSDFHQGILDNINPINPNNPNISTYMKQQNGLDPLANSMEQHSP